MFLQEKVSEINKKFEELKDMPNIVIWGASVHTAKLFEKTSLLSYSVRSVVDIDENKWGCPYFGLTIQSPWKTDWKNVSAVVISVVGRQKEITETLVNRQGFKGNIVALYEDDNCTPFYLLYDERVSHVRYLGDYDSWEDADKECDGYDAVNILDKVAGATMKVINGEAVWERDSWLFYEQKYVYQICAAILRSAVQNDNQGVYILDIGGALGSTYFQNKAYLANIRNLKYVIAEQDCFAEYGQTHIESSEIQFIRSTESYEVYGKPDIVLLSASLQYISQYQEVVSKVIKAKPNYIILDRLLVSNRKRICKETVPEEIYKGSYPVRIFSDDEVREMFGKAYEIIERDVSSVPEKAYFPDGKAESRYYVFQYKE